MHPPLRDPVPLGGGQRRIPRVDVARQPAGHQDGRADGGAVGHHAVLGEGPPGEAAEGRDSGAEDSGAGAPNTGQCGLTA